MKTYLEFPSKKSLNFLISVIFSGKTNQKNKSLTIEKISRKERRCPKSTNLSAPEELPGFRFCHVFVGTSSHQKSLENSMQKNTNASFTTEGKIKTVFQSLKSWQNKKQNLYKKLTKTCKKTNKTKPTTQRKSPHLLVLWRQNPRQIEEGGLEQRLELRLEQWRGSCCGVAFW